ncbi:SDR family oxidoreductase [Actinomadura darangshiensis]|uniref:SDR family oxidoreductase n=1 Tax=Actinomadura darangshiensis TaxID=705336 RepID=A0A4R5BUC1_9ACTN|nr:SDR family oxidoreductase [Actinomadura darangshiensis]TDD90681.1 SDR family oxidoreductase [Actinomadura darangshiensis]
MRVFVTGATGFVGSATVRELIGAGHEVVGLARSDEAAASLTAAGARVRRGSLDDPGGLRDAAAGADGVAHLAYKHDFSDTAGAEAADLRAIEAIGSALEGSGKPFAVASVIMLAAPGRVATEDVEPDANSTGAHRIPADRAAVALADRGVRSAAVRLPIVHGRGDRGFIPALIGIAREKGVSAVVGDGANRWPAVHGRDAARLFRLALEDAPAGSRLHAVGDEGVPFREIAGVIGRHLDVPVTGISPDEAAAHFGWLAHFASADGPASSALTEKLLGWRPEQPALIPDLDEGHYFGG